MASSFSTAANAAAGTTPSVKRSNLQSLLGGYASYAPRMHRIIVSELKRWLTVTVVEARLSMGGSIPGSESIKGSIPHRLRLMRLRAGAPGPGPGVYFIRRVQVAAPKMKLSRLTEHCRAGRFPVSFPAEPCRAHCRPPPVHSFRAWPLAGPRPP